MGIPKFFRWISERYPTCSQLVAENNVPPFDKFYLDMNGIIHHCSHGNTPSAGRPNSDIFRDIMGYLEILVSKIKPRQILYLAVDGVAPRAKMNQQRARRFRSALDAKLQREKQKQQQKTVEATGPIFDSNCITPGTVFMEELCKFLQEAIAEKVASDPSWRGFKTIFSGPDVPGEGEHKIMDYIRHCKAQPDYNPNVRHCLYGLDADLILLGLLSHDPHFALLREEVKFGSSQQKSSSAPARFFLMHLGLLREYIGLEFSRSLSEYSLTKGEGYSTSQPEFEDFDPENLSVKIAELNLHAGSSASLDFSTERVIDDLILLMCLVGNDFLPNLPHLHINESAIAIIWAAYKRIGKHVNEFGRVNFPILREILQELLPFEQECYERAGSLQFETPVISNRERTMLRSLLAGLQGGEAVWTCPSGISENERNLLMKLSEESGLDFSLLPDRRVRISSDDETTVLEAQRLVQAYILSPPVDDNLDGLGRWKIHYHDRKFGPDVSREDVIKAYLNGIQWVMSYYYDGVASWSWFFPYHYAPHLSDVWKFLVDYPRHQAAKFDIGEPFSPLNQLMSVLPPDSSELIPVPVLRTLLTSPTSPLADFYPRTFKTDQNGKTASWEAVVLIPFIEADRLVQQVQKALPTNYIPLPPGCDWEFNWFKGQKQPYLLPPVPKELFVKGLCEGVKDTIPGFPRLSYLRPTPRLEKAGLAVFPPMPPSANFSLCLATPTDHNFPAVPRVLYFGYPFVTETLVQYFDNGIVRTFPDGRRESSDLTSHRRTLEKQQIHWLRRYGITFEGEILAYGNLFKGMQMLVDGRIEKKWSSELLCIPLSLAVPSSRVEQDERYVERKSIITKDSFPLNATVLSIDGKKGIIRSFSFSTRAEDTEISVDWLPDPFVKTTFSRTPWISANNLSSQLSIPPFLLSKLTASLYTYFDEACEEYIDIGLQLKFEGREKAAEGMARKAPSGMWEYSNQAVDLITDYVNRIRSILPKLEGQTRPIFQKQLLEEISDYLKEIRVGKRKMVDSRQDRLEPSEISKLSFKKTSPDSIAKSESISAIGLITQAIAGNFTTTARNPNQFSLGQPAYICDRLCFGTACYIVGKTSEYVEVKLEEAGPTGLFITLPLASIIPVTGVGAERKLPSSASPTKHNLQATVQVSQWEKPFQEPGKGMSQPAYKIKPRPSAPKDQKLLHRLSRFLRVLMLLLLIVPSNQNPFLSMNSLLLLFHQFHLLLQKRHSQPLPLLPILRFN